MRAPFVAACAGLFAASVGAAQIIGCGDDDGTPKTAELRSVLAAFTPPAGVDGGTTVVDLLAPPDGGLSPFPTNTRFRLEFDGRLVGALVEGAGLGADAASGRDDAGVPTLPTEAAAAFVWLQGPSGSGLLDTRVAYDPAGAGATGQPSSAVLVTPGADLPASSRILLQLSRTRLVTQETGKAFLGVDRVAFDTGPFTLAVPTIPTNGATVTASQPIVLQFSSFVAADVARGIQVEREDGAALAIVVSVSPTARGNVTVSPSPAGARWQAGTFRLIVGSEARDAYGVGLASAPFVRTFTVVE